MMHNTGIKSGSAETASGALSASGPQPVWVTLNEARTRSFTGEIVFEVDPEVVAYLDHGVVYYAERTSDPPLGRRLLEAGVVDIEQLERGTVRVGDVEHLGRLFDRDPSVDRDAVQVVTETSTEQLIAEMANREIATVRVTAYRHHPSGVHRWFVAPIDAASARPLAAVAQLDGTVIDDLPGLSVADPGELTIEWDDIDDGEVPAAGLPVIHDEIMLFDPFREDEFVSLTLVEDVPNRSVDSVELIVDVDEAEWNEAMELTVEQIGDVVVDERADELAEEAADQVIEEITENVGDASFQVMWPDGTEQAATLENAYTEDDPSDDGDDHVVAEEPVFTQSEDGKLRFDMPVLELVDDDEFVGEVPDDVAEAVRRAIAAIESASVDTASIAPLDPDDPLDLDDLVDIDTDGSVGFEAAQAVDEPVADTLSPVLGEITTEMSTVETSTVETSTVETSTVQFGEPSPFAGFAPPTMATSAEVMYAQAAAAVEPVDEVVVDAASAPMLPTQGVASVVFVDDENAEVENAEGAGGSNERSSALRRLIGSLRRKDH